MGEIRFTAIAIAIAIASILPVGRVATVAAQTTGALELAPPIPGDLLQRTPPEALTDEAEPEVEAALVEFLSTRFRAHEPIYFVAGPVNPEAKFQISLKYQLFSETGDMARAAPWASDLYLAYSQTSLWELNSASSPFFDTSYRPELLYQFGPRPLDWLDGRLSRFDFQAGVTHISNGKAGLDSRSLNILYASPIFTFGDPGDDRLRAAPGRERSGEFFITLAPRVWTYIGDLDENPDIYQYRGYGDLRLIAGWRGGFQAALTGRLGNDWDKGSLQADFSYPLDNLGIEDLGMYLNAQFFTGYGESLLGYDQSDTTFRMGLSLVR